MSAVTVPKPPSPTQSPSLSPTQSPTQLPTQSPAPPGVDVKLIQHFVHAVRSVLRTMASVETQVLKPYLKKDNGRYNIFGIIGFSGDYTGSVALSFTRAAAGKLVEAFTGSAMDEKSPDFTDAIGELANMIAGSAKSALGSETSITVPTVVMGEDCHVAMVRGVPCVVIPCTCTLGEFAVEVCIKRRNAA